MVKKSEFNGVVRVEFESAKATDVTCLSISDCVMEVRHDTEGAYNRHDIIADDSLEVRAGERLVLVMAKSYVKNGLALPNECAEINRLYRIARKFRHDRLRVKIYSADEYLVNKDTASVVGYAWIGKGKGVADTTDTDNANTDNDTDELSACVLSALLGDWGFIGVSIVRTTDEDSEEYSNEYNYKEWTITATNGKNKDVVGKEIDEFLLALSKKYPNSINYSVVKNKTAF